MICPRCKSEAGNGSLCAHCGFDLAVSTGLTLDSNASGLAMEYPPDSPNKRIVGSITVDGMATGAAAARAAVMKPADKARVEYQPKFETVKRWAFKDIDHYQVLGIDLNAQEEEVKAR